MISILKKDFRAFFTSIIGLVVMGLFFCVSGSLLWVFDTDYNIYNSGFADLTPYFNLAPWLFLFLIPALSMRSFAEEYKQGTLSLLVTKPISIFQIVLAKYFSIALLLLLILIPTLIYVVCIAAIADLTTPIDYGVIAASYLGLFFVGLVYITIGLFASALTKNQIVAFLIAVTGCVTFYIGFDGITAISALNSSLLSLSAHYASISRGVIDVSDLIYFITTSAFFIGLTVITIKARYKSIPWYKRVLMLSIAYLIILFLSSHIHARIDITTDNRYTLTNTTTAVLNDIKAPLVIDVFLDGKQLPAEFKRLKNEIVYLLDEYKQENANIQYLTLNPLANDASRDKNIQQLTERGLIPMQISVNKRGQSKTDLIFPWALVSYNNTTIKVPLISPKIGASQQELVSTSIERLEYEFTNAINQLVYPKSKKIAVLKGNKELDDIYIADFLKTIRSHYLIAPFTLDSLGVEPEKTLNDLTEFDLLLIANPKEAFTESEKLILDQYTMQGGKSLWLIETVNAEQDSLKQSGKSIAFPTDLNLTDFFFSYGIRVNPNLVNDLYSAPITLATGSGSNTQFNQLPWVYSPLVTPPNNHPITKNINLIKFNFANQIDTLPNKLSKLVLLQSSELSKRDGVPREIYLESAIKQPNPELYVNGSSSILAVLIEGEFTSAYANRILPVPLKTFKKTSLPTKMIVVSDGDIIKNTVSKTGPDELGFDKWTGQTYGNKDFLLNAVNYLMDDSGLINIRSKTIQLTYLDFQKLNDKQMLWKWLNILIPIGFSFLIAIAVNRYRIYKYTN